MEGKLRRLRMVAALSTSIAGGSYQPEDGEIRSVDDLSFQRNASATLIADLPGWEPVGEWNVRHFGAYPDAPTANAAREVAAAIQNAYNAAIANRRPLYIGPGNWLVHLDENELDTGATNNNIAALNFYADGGIVFGAAPELTVIRCFVGGAYSAVAWRRTPLQNGVPKIVGGLYSDFTVDGGVDDPANSLTSSFPAGVASNLSGVRFERVRFCNSSHYGFGAQNGGHIHVTMTDCVFENTAFDGIDIKNSNVVNQPATGWAFYLIRPKFINCCQCVFPSPGAWCDIMGDGNLVDSPLFYGMGTTGNAQALLRIKQGQDATNTRGLGGYRNVVNGMQVNYVAGSPLLRLVDVRAPYCVIEDMRQTGDLLPAFVKAILVSQPYVDIVRPRLQGNGTGTGVHFSPRVSNAPSNEFAGGDHCRVDGGVFRGFSTAILNDREGVYVSGAAFPGCDVGVRGGTHGLIIGNNFKDCRVPTVLPDGTTEFVHNMYVT